jgi:phosphoserine phosphatase RsbU/P
MHTFFRQENPQYRRPLPASMPELPNAHFFALYRGARTGGDFYDFAVAGGRVLTLFCDISGKRDEALHIAAGVQEKFQEQCPELFSGVGMNEIERLSDLLLSINREIITTAKGARYTPAFVSCFDPEMGLLTYINAGHLPALLRDDDGISTLEASGLPLGLFSHSTHDAQVRVVRPGSSLLLVSRGVIETRRHHEEFGLDRVKENLLLAKFDNARELCTAMQAAAQRFLENSLPENDLTTLAMVRPLAASRSMSA